ncbi:MAG: metallophosphoesterase [Thermoproteota archaeon]
MPFDTSSILQDPDVVRNLEEGDIMKLLREALEVFRDERNLLKIDRGKTLFVGDTHGNFAATKAAIKIFSSEGFDRIVFLGDYVDRGDEQIENINYIIALKLLKPEAVLMLRGNHETISMNSAYGFWYAVNERLPENFYKLYNLTFSYIPLAAVTWNGIFAVHGGIAKGLERIEKIDNLPRGELDPSNDLVLQLLWNDPLEEVDGFSFNYQRGGFYYFGKEAWEKFMVENKLKMMLRSHEVFSEGFKNFFGGSLLSIFSSTGYCGYDVRGKAAQLSSEGEIDLIDIAIQ